MEGVAAASNVTLVLAGITTTSLTCGTTPPQVAALDQLPEAVALRVGAAQKSGMVSHGVTIGAENAGGTTKQTSENREAKNTLKTSFPRKRESMLMFNLNVDPPLTTAEDDDGVTIFIISFPSTQTAR